MPVTCGMELPKSVVFHFPPNVYRSSSSTEMLPQLLQALQSDKVSAVQFLRSGRVRVTLKCAEYRNELLRESSFLFGEVSVPVTVSDAVIRSVYVRDLPFEVPDANVQDVFQSFGVVHSVRPCYFRDFPSVANGTRILLMSFNESVQSIPSTLSVSDFPVRVWYAGQPVICPICHEVGHLPRACPFSGRCLRCRQPGHRARDCKQAWGPPRPSPPVSTSAHALSTSVPVLTTSAPVSTPASVPGSSSAPVSTVSVPSVSRVVSSVSGPVLPLVPVTVPITFPVPVPLGSQITFPVLRPAPVTSSFTINAPIVSPTVEEGEIVISPKSPQSPESDYRKLSRLTLTSLKPGSNRSAVLKLVKSLIKSHNLHVSSDELNCVVEGVLR